MNNKEGENKGSEMGDNKVSNDNVKKSVSLLTEGSPSKREKEQAKELESILLDAAEAKSKNSEAMKEVTEKLKEKFGGEILEPPPLVRQGEKKWDLKEGREYRWISLTPVDVSDKMWDDFLDEMIDQKLLLFDELFNEFLMMIEFPQTIVDKDGNIKFKNKELFPDPGKVFRSFKDYLECAMVQLKWTKEVDLVHRLSMGIISYGEYKDACDFCDWTMDCVSDFIQHFDKWQKILNDRAREALRKRVN